MAGFVERRKYQRCDTAICKAMMSTDNMRWNNLEICDISAGGLKFVASSSYRPDIPMYFNLYVYNMLSEFNMRLEGHIVREEIRKDKHYYSVKFDNMNKYTQVQLDELIKSKITVAKTVQQPADEDGIYTFLFIPRIRPRRISMYRK